MLKVALVDDDPLVLTLLADRLLPFGVHVEWSGSGPSALQKLRNRGTRPDVLVVDVKMPEMDGYELAHRITSEFQGIAIVMLTALQEQHALTKALEAGAVGFLVKSDPIERIVAGLRSAAEGLHSFSPAVRQGASLKAPHSGSIDPLSPREVEVLLLVAQSLTNDQIAKRLGIARDTVKRHVTSILGKLGVPDRLGAVMWGVRRGLLT